jgi:hypothetical protein
VRDQVSHPYKVIGTIVVLYPIAYTFSNYFYFIFIISDLASFNFDSCKYYNIYFVMLFYLFVWAFPYKLLFF